MLDTEWTVLRELALAYVGEDPDPVTREALSSALEREDRAFVQRAFQPRLEFGTAGLRGAVGAGPAQLNLLVCGRFAWALGTFLSRRPDLAKRGVLVGFDARRDSERFARTIESVLGNLGIGCWSAQAPLPTPVVAFGVRQLAAGAGVVVTASHNPAPDNGIKLYDDEGLQIVAPWDHEIEALMQVAPRYSEMIPSGAPHGAPRRSLEADVVPAYLAQLRARATRWPARPRLSVAYTPLHGVGLETLRAAISELNVDLRVVAEQADPDADFPTAPLPNPEEPGTLDRLLALASREGVDLALANDPDADRLAAALPDGQGGYVKLSGDELGLLLCDGLFDPSAGPPVCVSSIVSSPGIEVWARENGGRVLRTLTGFKWLARAARSEGQFLLVYEEALGYCSLPPAGHLGALDKDGLAAAVDLIGCAMRAGSGRGLLQRLARLSVQLGVWVCHPESIRLRGAPGARGASQLMDRLRSSPPVTLGDEIVDSVTDYRTGSERRSPWLGSQDLLELRTRGGIHLLVRPSGTEPKVKVYTHVVGAADGASCGDYLRRRQELLVRAQRITAELMQQLGIS